MYVYASSREIHKKERNGKREGEREGASEKETESSDRVCVREREPRDRKI